MENIKRNYLITDVSLNWARLDKPTNPFGTEQYELQIETTDTAKAQELRDNHFNVKDKDGKFVVSLKRKALRANGEDNGKVRLVDAQKQPMDTAVQIGNGSIGNVIVFQYSYDAMGRTGVASSLTAVQVTDLVEYQQQVDFDDLSVSSDDVEPVSF